VSDATLLLPLRPEQSVESGLEFLPPTLHDERLRLRNAADALYRHDDVVRHLRARRKIATAEHPAFLPSPAAFAELLASVMCFARAAGQSGVAVGEMLDGVAAELRRTALRRAPAPLGGDLRADAVRRAVRAYYDAAGKTAERKVS
jgi:hypothetical protein